MAVHKLSLEIPQTLNSCILRVIDTSVYNPDMVAKCPRLQISVPGFSSAVFLQDISTEFSLNLTACDLGIQTSNCNTDFNDLPDLVYVITYSVSPNDQVYVEYNHLRMAKALNRLQKLYCQADYLNCVPGPQLIKLRNDARTIREYLYAAEAMVGWCRQVSKGIELYKEAVRLLDKIDCGTC